MPFVRACWGSARGFAGAAPSALRVLLTVAQLAGFAALAACSARPQRAEKLGHAVLVGRVRLVPSATLPAYAPFDLQRAPLLGSAGGAAPRAQCADALERARRPVQRTAEGFLSGVVVAASDFTGITLGWPPTPHQHHVVIDKCTLQPALVAARAGDWIELRNDDAFAHAPQLGASTKALPLAPGKRVILPVEPGHVTSLLCPPGAPCGRTDVIVFHHPLFAVTDARGSFRIEGFPNGEMVRVTAWHPLFEPSETFVWVEAGEQGQAELLLEPKARFVERTP